MPYLFGLTQTMPYGHCSTFAGNDHPNVDHIRVAPDNWKFEGSTSSFEGWQGGMGGLARQSLSFSDMLSADAQAGDQVDDLRDQIEAHGHTFTTTRGNFLPPPVYNIFAEGTLETLKHPARVHEMARAGYGLIALITEEPTLVTTEGLCWNYMTTGTWEHRADLFVEIAPALSAAWCYVPGGAAIMRRFVAVAADIDMAWGQRFNRRRPLPVPHFDFCFFGGLTPRRQRMLAEIAKRGFKVDIIPHSSSLARRDERIPHSRIVLDIKQHHWWDLVSSVRYVTALCCGRPVVAEWRSERFRAGWEGAVRFAPPGELIDVAADQLARWAPLYDAQVAWLRGKPDTLEAAIAKLPAIPEKPNRTVLWPTTPAPVERLDPLRPAPVQPLPQPPGRMGPPHLVEAEPGFELCGMARERLCDPATRRQDRDRQGRHQPNPGHPQVRKPGGCQAEHEEAMRQEIVVLGGLGDAYLVMALYDAFLQSAPAAQHHPDDQKRAPGDRRPVPGRTNPDGR